METRELDPEVCGNCNKSFDTRRGMAATKRFIYKGFTNGVRMESSVAMWKALIEIFDLKSLGIWNKGGCTLELDTELALCQVCGLAVAKLYGAMRAYLELQDEKSYMREVVNRFSDEFAKLVNETEEFGSSNPAGMVIKKDSETTELKLGTGRRPVRRVTPKKFLYEGTVRGGDTEAAAEGDYDDHQDEDYFPPGAYATERSEAELDYYVPPNRPAPQSDFQDPNSQISQELFSIDFDPEVPSPKEYVAKEHLCQICATGFDKASNLKRHLLLTHEIGERTKDFVCTFCGKAFYFNYLLKNHQVSHSIERPSVCNICHATFKSKDSLLHHVRDVHRDHEDDPKLKCKYCQRQFRQIRCLNEHIVMIHRVGKGKKLIACSKGCGATFKRKKSMLGHVRQNQCRDPESTKPKSKKKTDGESKSDSGEQETVTRERFYCPHKCGSVYKSKPSLTAHIRSRCPKNPALSRRMKQARMKARAKVIGKNTKFAEASTSASIADADTEPMEEEHGEPVSVELEEELHPNPIKDEAEEMIVAEEHEITADEDASTEGLEEVVYEEVGVETQQVYEVYEVQELPEGVQVHELQADDIIQTIHYGDYQIQEETQ